MSANLEEIRELALAYTGLPRRTILDTSPLFGGGLLEGDDADEFLEAFAIRFNVDLSNFLLYFHCIGDEPPVWRRVLPIDADGKVIPFQPITVVDLVKAAEVGRWEWDYPEHTVRHSWRNPYLWTFVGLVGLVGLAGLIIIFESCC